MTDRLPDAVLFDMDGLLIDSERLSLQSFSETITDHGLEDHGELFLKVIGSNETSLVAILFEALAEKLDVVRFRSEWAERYHALIAYGEVPLKPGVPELLEWLSSNKVKTAVATSSSTDIATLKLTRTGIIGHFQVIVGGDQVKNSKPDPEIFLAAAAALAADASKTLVLEDSTHGVRAGVAAGFTVIQVPDLVQPSAELMQLGHQVSGSLHEVLALLQSGGIHFVE